MPAAWHLEIRSTFGGDDEGEVLLSRELMRFSDSMARPRLIFDVVADELREITHKQFDTEGRHASGGWKPLADSTVAYKRRRGLDPHILRATNRLMTSLTRKGDPEQILRPSSDSLVFGSTVHYGVFHQSSAPRKRLPFRPPLALTAADRREMVKRCQRAIIEGMYGRGEKRAWGS